MIDQAKNNQARASQPVGEGDYVVGQGECLVSISERSGHYWQTIWEHIENRDLKTLRKDPAVLYPDDKVFIPPIVCKPVSVPTDHRHRFMRKGVPTKLRMQFLNDGVPKASSPYRVDIDGRITQGKSDGEGHVDIFIPTTAGQGQIWIGEGEELETYDLKLGTIDPIDTIAGIQGRLMNLGFRPGPVSGTLTPATQAALRRFQKVHDLEPTGEINDEARRILLEEHGC